MKKGISIFVIASLMLTTLFVSWAGINVKAADSEIKVSINGKLQQFVQSPVIIDGNTLVPMRGIFEALGATITWNGEEKSVTAIKNKITIYLKIDENQALVNNEKINLVVPAQLINGSTMVPIRFVSEALGASVNWDGATKTVLITSIGSDYARKLLEEGLAEEGMSIEDFSFQYIHVDTRNEKKLGNLLRGMWEQQLGIEVRNLGYPYAIVSEKQRSNEYDVGLFGWGPDYNDPMTWLHLFKTNSNFNYAKWSNPRYDELIDLAEEETNQEKRLEYFLEAEKILLKDEHAIAPLYYDVNGYLLKPYVKNLIVKQLGPNLELKWTSINTEQAIKNGQVLNMYINENPQLDLKTLSDFYTEGANNHTWIINSINEGLVRVGPNGLAQGMAESWKISEDGTKYTFNIRKNAKWSDGSPVTAKDFIYAWERVINKENEYENSFILTDYIKGAEDYHNYSYYQYLKKLSEENPFLYYVRFDYSTPAEVVYGEDINPEPVTIDQVGFKAIDTYTLEIELNKNTPWFLEMTSYPIYMPLNKAFYENNKEEYGTSKETLIYNGPWVISEWNDQIILTKNDDYWDKEYISLDKINIDINERSVESKDLNQYDFSFLSEGQSLELMNDPNYHTSNKLITFWLNFNTNKKPFNNPKVRQALSMVIDRKELKEHDIFTVPAYGLIPTEFKGYSTTSKTFREISEKKFGQLIYDIPYIK